ncbi:MAG: MogA/MoaB family molybdenum cofactor biosynthesis protein [Candidatus Zixiibacteriota bacterium]|nr:MAG: MogA/MoaB family molybdenum cofactor biosynthesis protein [candidate division Zixibacteria bacterium]
MKQVGQSEEKKYEAAILIASDRSYRGSRADKTGPELRKRLERIGYDVCFLEVVADDRQSIVSVLRKWINTDKISLILVAGGTGPAPRDVTPEATLDVIERRIPGMEEAMRFTSFKKTPYAILSRAVVGCAGKSLIVNLPGSVNGALENLEVIEPVLVHAMELISGGTPDK